MFFVWRCCCCCRRSWCWCGVRTLWIFGCVFLWRSSLTERYWSLHREYPPKCMWFVVMFLAVLAERHRQIGNKHRNRAEKRLESDARNSSTSFIWKLETFSLCWARYVRRILILHFCCLSRFGTVSLYRFDLEMNYATRTLAAIFSAHFVYALLFHSLHIVIGLYRAVVSIHISLTLAYNWMHDKSGKLRLKWDLNGWREGALCSARSLFLAKTFVCLSRICFMAKQKMKCQTTHMRLHAFESHSAERLTRSHISPRATGKATTTTHDRNLPRSKCNTLCHIYAKTPPVLSYWNL